MKIIKAENLLAEVGSDLGTSDWITIEQDRVNQFADVTEDHQFIHVDPEMAKKTPFGGPIAHGFLTLSLLSKFSTQCGFQIEDVKMGVNYGFEKVRFLAPVKVGKKVRGHFKLKAAEEKRPGQYLLTYEISVEIEGEEKPALVADWLGMMFTG